MNDILPEQTPTWRYLENTLAALLDGYGYKEIRLPVKAKQLEIRPFLCDFCVKISFRDTNVRIS